MGKSKHDIKSAISQKLEIVTIISTLKNWREKLAGAY